MIVVTRTFKIKDGSFNFSESAYSILGGLIFKSEREPSDDC